MVKSSPLQGEEYGFDPHPSYFIIKQKQLSKILEYLVNILQRSFNGYKESNGRK
jgi:hypothetical protein